MTVHKVRTCSCGHAETFHAEGRGKCTYGHGHVMGGCDCPKFSRRRRAAASLIVDALPPPKIETLTLKKAVDQAIVALAQLSTVLGLASRPMHMMTTDAPNARAHLNGESRIPRKTIERAVDGAPKLKLGERKMLAALAQHHPQKLTRAQLGTLVGIRGGGSTFGVYLGVLKRHALVDVAGELIGLTPAGVEHVGPATKPKMTRAEIAALWMSKLKAGERKMLDAVITEGEVTRDELGDIASIDPHGSTFGVYLGTLKRNDLVVVVGNRVRLGTALAEAS